MKIVKGENGIEFTTMTLKEYKNPQRFYFVMGFVSLGIGWVLGNMMKCIGY